MVESSDVDTTSRADTGTASRDTGAVYPWIFMDVEITSLDTGTASRADIAVTEGTGTVPERFPVSAAMLVDVTNSSSPKLGS